MKNENKKKQKQFIYMFLVLSILIFITPVSAEIYLNDIIDCNVPTPNDNEVLTYDNATANWTSEPTAIGVSVLDDLINCNVPTPNDNEVLTYDNATANWTSEPTAIGESALWNQTDTTLYTAINNTNVQINGSFNITLIKNVTGGGEGFGEWTNYRTITIESDFVNSGVVNFPILLSIDDTTGDKCKSNGEDIFFVLPDNSTILNHEIEKWVDNDERLVWVNFTSISHDSDTTILMYYGNDEASDSQNPTDVWDTDFLAVYHMDDKTTSTLDDSTINDITADKIGVNNPVEGTGKIGEGQVFTSSRIDTIVDMRDYDESFTWEVWAYSTDILTEQSLIKPSDSSVQTIFRDAQILFLCTDHTSTRPSYTANEWYSVAFVGTDVGHFIYKNGSLASEPTNTDTADITSDDIVIGARPLGGEPWIGRIDEIRFSKIVRSADWLNITYHTQNQTTGFLVWGVESESENGTPPYAYDELVNIVSVNSSRVIINTTLIMSEMVLPTIMPTSPINGSVCFNATTGKLGIYSSYLVYWVWK